MKKVIEKKVYNTETAELIGEYYNGLSEIDFSYFREGLYITKKGAYFMAGSGGALSKYRERNGRDSWCGEGIRVVDKDEALAWCEKYNLIEEIENYFGDMIEEG